LVEMELAMGWFLGRLQEQSDWRDRT
jgi:hypothetical protein